MRLSQATDTRLLVAGVAASLALVAYLALAFATTHASSSPNLSITNRFAPWVPKYHSKLALFPEGKGGGVAVHVEPRWVGTYGAVVPTVVSQPPPRSTVLVRLELRGPGRSPIRVVVDEFPAGPNPDIVSTTVPATRRWHRYTFRARITGEWLGLGMFVGRDTNGRASRWFAARRLTVKTVKVR